MLSCFVQNTNAPCNLSFGVLHIRLKSKMLIEYDSQELSLGDEINFHIVNDHILFQLYFSQLLLNTIKCGFFIDLVAACLFSTNQQFSNLCIN